MFSTEEIEQIFGRLVESEMRQVKREVNEAGREVNEMGREVNEMGGEVNEAGGEVNEMGREVKKLRIELNYSNHFTCLVAVILSARMTDKGVNRATEQLFERISTPEEMVSLGMEGLYEYIKTVGLYKTKGKHIVQMSQILIEKYNSQVPNTLEELEELPGVGRKTANVVLNELFGLAVFPVDTHVFRVCNRLGLTNAKTPVQVEEILKKIVPLKFGTIASNVLVLHGRYVCKARKPLCEECVVRRWCEFYNMKMKCNV